MRSEGCAVISSTIAAISPTRHPSPLSIGSLFSQAALAHLEGIIYDPNEHLRDDHEADSESKIDGAPEDGQFSDREVSR